MKLKFEIDTDNYEDLLALRNLIDFYSGIQPTEPTSPPSDETILELFERKASETEERMANELNNPLFSPGLETIKQEGQAIVWSFRSDVV